MVTKFIQKNWKSFSNKCGGTWFYWHAISHSIELIKEYKKIFKKYIPKDSKILDLGAGRLFYRKMLLNYTNNYKSLDFQKTHQDLDFIGETHKTNLPDNSFDIVFCSQVLEHVPVPNESFAEMHRILKKDGIAIISTPFLMYLHNEPYDFFRYTKHALKKFAEENHFEILEIKELGGFFGFLGSVLAMGIIGLFWKIPILNYLFYFINLVFQYLFLFLDAITKNKKIFPSHYVMVIKK